MCLSAPSPGLQSVADPDMHDAAEISRTATPAVVPVESKALQTEETDTPAVVPVESKGLQTEETDIPQVTYLQHFTL